MPNIQIFNGVVPEGERGDGCLPFVPGDRTTELPLFDRALIFPRADIDDRLLEIKDIVLNYAESTPWIDQGSQGSCNPSSYGHSLMYLNAQEGEEVELLSQATLYAFDGIDRNGDLIPRRSDNGMAMATGILLARMLGMAPVSAIAPMDWQRRNWPADWKSKADDHKVIKWRDVSASLGALDSALALPVPVNHGYAGHARCIIWKDPKEKVYYCKNSWESQPWHYLTESQVRQGQLQYEAFCPITTVAV